MGATGAGGAYPVSDYELASRLSYFLWSSMPDDELFRLAQPKGLHKAGGARGAGRSACWRTRKPTRSSKNFGEQWLNLRVMDRTKPDAADSPVDDELLDAMRRETCVRRGGDPGRPQHSRLRRRPVQLSSTVRWRALRHQRRGRRAVPARRARRRQRSGLMTQGSILTISSYATRTSPVLRGKWVLDNLLGAPPPPPPDNIPPLEDKELGPPRRCGSGSSSTAPTYLRVLPRPDGPDRLRSRELRRGRRVAGQGRRVRDRHSGTLPDGRTFTGAEGLKQVLRSRTVRFARNFTEKLMMYALGRGLERADRPVVDQITPRRRARQLPVCPSRDEHRE